MRKIFLYAHISFDGVISPRRGEDSDYLHGG
jgi:hypothetical protein